MTTFACRSHRSPSVHVQYMQYLLMDSRNLFIAAMIEFFGN
jgi:hypothetical protein